MRRRVTHWHDLHHLLILPAALVTAAVALAGLVGILLTMSGV